jgi:tetratricopeptide (TPR) repeat protein
MSMIRWGDAHRLLTAAVEVDPSFAMAHFELWLLHSGYGTMPNARSERHRRSTLDNIDRLTDRQRLLVQAFNSRFDGDLERGAEILEELIAVHPDEEWAYELLANIYGWGLFREDDHFAAYERGVKANPRSSLLWTGHAYALLYTGRYKEALEGLETVVEMRPREPNPHDNLGDYYLVTGRPDVGLQKYARALEIDPSFSSAHTGRAWAFAMLGQYEDALAEAAQFSGSGMHFFNAYLLSRVGRYRESASVASEGIRLAEEIQDPAVRADFALLDAIVALEQGDYGEVLNVAERARGNLQDHRDQALRESSERFVHILVGFARVGEGNLDAARSEAETVRDLLARPHWAPDDWWYTALEGEIAFAKGDLDAVEVSYRRGEPEPKAFFVRLVVGGVVYCNNPPRRDLLARVAAARGDLARAIEIYRALNTPSIESKWTSALEPRYVLEIARLLDQKGDYDAAREEYGRFLELWKNADPGLPELEEARTAVARLEGRAP